MWFCVPFPSPSVFGTLELQSRFCRQVHSMAVGKHIIENNSGFLTAYLAQHLPLSLELREGHFEDRKMVIFPKGPRGLES